MRTRIHHRSRLAPRWPLLASCVLALPLAGCLSSDGSSSPGSGQGPDPVVVDFAVAYVKRPVPATSVMSTDVRRILDYQPGGDLYVREKAAPSGSERNVTIDVTEGKGDVRDVEPSFDGTKLIFALRKALIPDAEPAEQPKWGIWEYDLTTKLLRRVIPSDITANEGHDFAPHYLPDGRIVFSSTRQRQSKAILLDEGKPQYEAQDESRDEPAFVLHVMNADGSGIHQISFNQSHDLDPSVLPDGRVVFTRWDHAPGHDEFNLYAVRPDGTGLELLYGAHSHETGTDGTTIQFLDPRTMPNGHLLVRAQPFDSPYEGSELLDIDVASHVDDSQPLATGTSSGPAQKPATVNLVTTNDAPSPGGRFSAAYPLFDNTGRILVSWSQCRLLEGSRIVPCTDKRLGTGSAVEAPPLYGVFIYDPVQQTQMPIASPAEGVIFTDIVAAQPRKLPPVILDRVAGVDYDAEFDTESVGILDIRSVYDIDGVDTAPGGIATVANPALTTAAQRPARFLRIEKPVSLPDRDTLDFRNSAFGVTGEFGMREILGYAPVEPDGSVRVKVPANVPFAITVLDANGRRIGPRHENWLQVRPGQELKCNGCHDPDSGLSHGRPNLFNPAWAGAPTTGLPFPNTNPAFFANAGDTMAQVRARISCQTDCASLKPNSNLVYTDVWTDPVAAGRAADAPTDYNYADLTTPAPASSDCIVGWRSGCRVTIHYEKHIHPLWSKPRVSAAGDDTCTTCHGNRSTAGAVQLPAGQLELTDGASADEPDRFQAYQELLATDNEQELVNGVLQDKLVQVGIDPVTGLPQFAGIPVPPPLQAGNANASVAFFALFAPGGSHAGRLTAAELKLISEWVDSGAQYFNDPFAAPLN
jgi:hypothetical protein